MLISDLLKQSNKFTATEKLVIQYMLSNPQLVLQSTIKELGLMTNSSSATIHRICRKIHLDGFSDLKIKLAQEYNSFSIDNYRIEVDLPISQETPNDQIMKQFLNLHYQSLTDTFNNIDYIRLWNAAQMLLQASNIMIVGTGESMILGSDFHYKLLRIGKNSNLEAMEGFQLSKVQRLTNKNTVTLVISQYGRSTSVLRTIKTLAHNGMQSILITSAPQNPMIPYATMSIIVANSETHAKMGSFASRTAILYVLDCIYAFLFKHDFAENLQTIDKYHQIRNL